MIGLIMGTRPEVVKNYSIVKALKAEHIDFKILHTNQHSDWQMSGQIFEEMEYGADIVFQETYSFGGAISWIEEQIQQLGIDLIIVNGDTAAALIGTLAGLYNGIKIAHIEAGLRASATGLKKTKQMASISKSSRCLRISLA